MTPVPDERLGQDPASRPRSTRRKVNAQSAEVDSRSSNPPSSSNAFRRINRFELAETTLPRHKRRSSGLRSRSWRITPTAPELSIHYFGRANHRLELGLGAKNTDSPGDSFR